MAANGEWFCRVKELYRRQNRLDFLYIIKRFYGKSSGKIASTLVQKSTEKTPQIDNGKNTNLTQGEAPQDLPSNTNSGKKFRIRPKNERLNIDILDWPSFYSTASSYNSWIMPLPIRMGRSRHNKVGGMPLKDLGNIELLKIPNFFHLTPPAIERHCDALKDFCTPWPDCPINRPVQICTKNFVFNGPSLRHPKSHIVHLKVFLKDLVLDEHARKKMVDLAGHRYTEETDELTITADRCPTRKQNIDYAWYLLNVLYHESWKTEPWEVDCEDNTEGDDLISDRRAQNRRQRKKYKIIGNELYRINKYGKAFKVYVKQHGNRFSYDS